jgi:hypothetical protein
MQIHPISKPGGSDTEVQYNDDNVFGGDATLTFNKTTKTLTSTGIIDASAGEVLVEDKDTDVPTGKSDGYIGVAKIGGQSKLFFAVDGIMYYVDGTPANVPANGNPIGLLLTLTYAGL